MGSKLSSWLGKGDTPIPIGSEAISMCVCA